MDLDLREGDIIEPRHKRRVPRNTVLNKDKLWDLPVPYVLDETLALNAKGIILRAFEQFRLKSCVNFKPRGSEYHFISAQKNRGCSSHVGRSSKYGQPLSIGNYCDHIGIVEHEFLHALGIWHEQSRYDRDEYVTIVWKNIRRGHERNFVKVSPHYSTTLGFPYDYSSVLHYSETSFSKGEGPTIITKQPEYQKIIGQRLEMSPQDALMLNKLYGCKKSISFMEHCNFDNQRLCGMSRCTKSFVGGWKRMKTVIGGPYSDFTNLGKTDGTGFFMHASTASGQEGDTARLESREMTPSRKCSVQCLQFYYYHSGNESDQLNVWMRVYRDERNPNGTLHHMGQITGSPGSHWMPYHVPLNATKTFQVEFEVRKGAGQSTGGFSIDDINLSETECPHHTWQIKDFENLLTTSDINTVVYSPRYYSPEGYAYQIAIYLREMLFGVYVRLVSGTYDDQLQWPYHHRQVTIQLLDQNPHTQQRMSKQISITTEPSLQDDYDSWNNPRKVGMLENRGDKSFYVNPAVGYLKFLTLTQLKHREFLKGGNIFFLITMQGMILIMIVLS
ncbi:meprin A subunit beta-like [Oncorhynchus clarkii lewisi]|uniref:meprin A subunit beta-like n=1 Tax=Oncorhynchus clarkii lewisi TaxID=490388 RepID=UPI0039B87754